MVTILAITALLFGCLLILGTVASFIGGGRPTPEAGVAMLIIVTWLAFATHSIYHLYFGG